MMTFKELNLSPTLLNKLETHNFVEPTEIQCKSIPLLLSKDLIDFHGQAQTGTGKTLAFGLPMLDKIDLSRNGVQGLIVAPTRELVVQISESLSTFAAVLGVKIAPIYGGVSIERQLHALKRGGVHLVIGTPGRLNDHLRRKTLRLDDLKTLVLDEADIMLDMGFKEEVDEILSYAPSKRQIWLFSATIKEGIDHIKKAHMKDVVSVTASKKQIVAENTKQYVCVTTPKNRFDALRRFIDSEITFYGFVFCPTKVMTGEVGDLLVKHGYNAATLHGDMNQAQRNEVIKKFKNKEYNILVATDVAARGIDVSHVTHVINYCLPDDQESYIHRIGRTGRAGKDGVAITFIGGRDMKRLGDIKRKFKLTIDPITIPSYERVVEARIERAQAYLDDLVRDDARRECIKLDQYIQTLSPEQLKKIVRNVVHQRFMAHLPQDTPIESAPTNKFSFDTFNFKEILIPVGSDDQVKKGDVIAFLTSSGVLQEDHIQKIRVIKRRTFVEIPSALTHALINSLRHKKIGNRNVRLRVLTN